MSDGRKLIPTPFFFGNKSDNSDNDENYNENNEEYQLS